LVLVFLCPSLESVRRIFQLVRRRKDGDQRKKIKKARKAEISKAVSGVINRQRQPPSSHMEIGIGIGIGPEILGDGRIMIIQTHAQTQKEQPEQNRSQNGRQTA